MLCALVVFSLTTLAVFKKDHLSPVEALAKFREERSAKPAATPEDKKSTPAPEGLKPVVKTEGVPSQAVPESAKAGSPAPVARP